MSNPESVLENPPTQDAAVHDGEYSRFIQLLKSGAIACLIIGLLWMMIVAAYW